jgi:hypothetical protein
MAFLPAHPAVTFGMAMGFTALGTNIQVLQFLGNRGSNVLII